jgi:hypothetical protein
VGGGGEGDGGGTYLRSRLALNIGFKILAFSQCKSHPPCLLDLRGEHWRENGGILFKVASSIRKTVGDAEHKSPVQRIDKPWVKTGKRPHKG